MLLTVLMCSLSMASTDYLKFQLGNMWLFYVAIVMTIVIMIVVCCFPKTMQEVPTNYIILGLFTLCEAYTVSIVCGLSNPRLVFMAAFMTLALTVALTLYAFTTKTDFTMMGSSLWILGCTLLMFSLFAMFSQNNILHIVICCFSVILYSIYLIYDTQLLMGGHKHELSPDDYCIAAIMIYMDIIILFLNILDLLNRINKD